MLRPRGERRPGNLGGAGTREGGEGTSTDLATPTVETRVANFESLAARVVPAVLQSQVRDQGFAG